MNDKERINLLRATLMGVQGMGQIEVAAGSRAWTNAVEKIEEVLRQTGEETTWKDVSAEYPKTVAWMEKHLKQPSFSHGMSDAEIEQLSQQPPLPEGWTEYSEHETAFQKVKRTMNENQTE